MAASSTEHKLELPTIDFKGVESGGARRREVVEEIRQAAKEWGFFNIVNHGVPLDTMDAMLDAVKRFHEQPTEAKSPFRSYGRRNIGARFSSKAPFRQSAHHSTCWRDELTCTFKDDQFDPQVIPLACRKEMLEYKRCIVELRETMAELLSEALGLRSDYLSNIECMKSQTLGCFYYPICPEPDTNVGTPAHSDKTFLTLLMQDSIGGLQILHHDQWVDVPSVHGALIAIIGDLMQAISNDKFVSVEHRVVAQSVWPRISVVCFLNPSTRATAKPFAPIKELLSDENPAIYREFLFREFSEYYQTKGKDAASALAHFKI